MKTSTTAIHRSIPRAIPAALLILCMAAPGAQVAAQRGATQPNNEAMALLLDQIQQLQTEVQALRNLVEVQGHEVRRLQQESLARYTNVDQRLIMLEGSSAGAPPGGAVSYGVPDAGGLSDADRFDRGDAAADDPADGDNFGTFSSIAGIDNITVVGDDNTAVSYGTGASNPGGSSLTTTDLPSGSLRGGTPSRSVLQPTMFSEQQLYQMAYDSVISSDFERAIAEFAQYLSVYPQGRFVTNAYYWRGQAFLYLERFEEALEAYQVIVYQHPESTKLPDAMYGLALTHQALGEIEPARKLLNDIKTRFPNTGVANLADARLLSLQASNE